jgi:hypothetical protein
VFAFFASREPAVPGGAEAGGARHRLRQRNGLPIS